MATAGKFELNWEDSVFLHIGGWEGFGFLDFGFFAQNGAYDFGDDGRGDLQHRPSLHKQNREEGRKWNGNGFGSSLSRVDYGYYGYCGGDGGMTRGTGRARSSVVKGVGRS